MFRVLSLASVAALVLATPVEAKRVMRLFTPVEKLVRADVVAVGKVTALEKDTVTAAPAPGATDKLTYKIAVLKVETGLYGAATVTHVKVGFIPPAPVDPNAPPAPVRPGRGGFQQVNLTVGLEGLFYLTKHHSGEFYVISPILAPTEATADGFKDQVAMVKKGVEVLADPTKALKAEKADDRLFAANVLVTKYRTYPEGGGEVENVKVPADESKLILKALAEGNWKSDPKTPQAPNAYQSFGQLGLTDKDGWTFPAVKPGEDFIDKTKDAFTAWLAGAGKDYQIEKLVVKK
ncbi:hypothetical protein [Frigoriglobus tundricola]|uniref:Assimilatory nitrate reductase large subunit n=1 Tax=Frigoriglobus tundricola TaxID=2774151 RepID=A0A6M5YSH0_9BACT|nr:hypothetical protein [Frigoriglobus tundricola]QJW96819.1 Assimilatory nitrate reductase large subunit [Frigoriglobus tundricola]